MTTEGASSPRALYPDIAGKTVLVSGGATGIGEIAQMALFLGSEVSSMCPAQNFIIDGGWV